MSAVIDVEPDSPRSPALQPASTSLRSPSSSSGRKLTRKTLASLSVKYPWFDLPACNSHEDKHFQATAQIHCKLCGKMIVVRRADHASQGGEMKDIFGLFSAGPVLILSRDMRITHIEFHMYICAVTAWCSQLACTWPYSRHQHSGHLIN